ncbi:hypothetical protein [Endozoicomonas sp. SESOKO4]|uniref:hypothetical protein n=1 Tax=Endozoicomonas sp. SESOKO4 TaxID=2828745 RepID=UPI0021491279|nr:hypothetical protein [Endozoicomonas sp. SESOKO4]
MDAIKRIVLRLFPELSYGYHLPLLARVENITDAPKDGGTCTMERPRFAVDIQPLNQHGDDYGELLRDVPVSTPYAGNERGLHGLPDPGAIVEYAFAFGRPDQPYIRNTLPVGLELPTVDKDEARWQKSATIYQGYDSADNWHRATPENIKDSAGKIRECQAQVKQLLKSPKTWLGSDTENVLRILSDALSETASALNVIANHTHPGVGRPNESGAISGHASNINSTKSDRLDPITE